MVRIIIAGGRDFYRYKLLKSSVIEIISDLKERLSITDDEIEIVSGAARGADEEGERFAKEYNYKLTRFPADWSIGRSAGYERNKKMAIYAQEDKNVGVLIAFWDGKSKGTNHMIALARKYGLEVHIVNY